MKKLIISLLLAFISALAFTSCSNNAQNNTVSIAKPTEPDLTDENGVGYNIQEDGTLKVVKVDEESKKVKIPDEYDGKAVTAVGRSSFKMTDVKSVTIPDGVYEIEDYAFAFCKTLEKVNIPEGVEEIGANAFSGCSKLTEITLPESLKTIGVFSFDASGLKSVTIPKGVKSIDQFAFAECTDLEEVIFNGKNTEVSENVFESSSGVKIIAKKNSNAITLAKEKGLEYEEK